MRTVVLNLTQKISAISCPSRQTLPPERSLRSAHRLSAELHSKTDVCGRTESSAPTGCCVSVKSRLPAIIKIACGAASEEASCIALPPGRRKLHIRWLLLPFQTATAVLGRSLGIRGHFRFWGFSFLFFTGRGDSFLSQRRERKEWAQKTLHSFVHKRVWNVETGAVEKRLTDVSQRLLWTTL